MTPELVVKALETFAAFLMKYFIALAAVGAFTMALMEACKTIFDIKTRFHLSFVKRFINSDKEAQRTSQEISATLEQQNDYIDTFSELVHLISGIEVGKARNVSYKDGEKLLTVFSLETANMMGKIQDAVDAAIDDPNRYRNLFIFATSGSDTADAVKWLEIANPPPGDNINANMNNTMKTRSELYKRLHQLAKRKLDRLQLQITYRWANVNQFYANVLGGLILFCTLLWINRNETMYFDDYLIVFIASTTGGILSPVAKDMISWLQKVKSRG